MKVGITIKLLENIYDNKKNIVLSEFDLVRVIKINKDIIFVKDILDNIHKIPIFTKYKISKASLPVSNKIEFKAAPTQDVVTENMYKIANMRNAALAQVIVANALGVTDTATLAKLSIASNLLHMSVTRGVTAANSSRMYQLARKLISEMYK